MSLNDSFKRLEYLKSISLGFFSSRNKMTDIGLNDLSECLTKVDSLQSVSLSFTCCGGITDEGISNLEQCLKKISPLQSIHLTFRSCKGSVLNIFENQELKKTRFFNIEWC